MKKGLDSKLNQNKTPSTSGRFRPLAVFSVVSATIIGLGIAAYATNTLLHGHVTVTQKQTQSVPTNAVTEGAEKNSSLKSTASRPKASSDLVDKYGMAATSAAVAAAIRNAESAPNSAKAAADRYEALQNGRMLPGTDSMQVLMHGYVPPGMAPQQAAMLYGAAPHLPKMPEAMTPDRIARMAGVPLDPVAGLPQGFSRDDVEAANQKMFAGYMREHFGPVYVPPLHRDHNRVAQTSNVVAQRIVRDHQISLIQPQYVYDPAADSHSVSEMTNSSGVVQSEFSYDPYGRPTQIAGSGVVPDFGFDGYYLHQRSGLNLTRTRAYSPVLGRFLNRDPIEETGSSINLFAYVANNPINQRDPSGLAPHVPGLPGPISPYYPGCYVLCEHNLKLPTIRPGEIKPRPNEKTPCDLFTDCMNECLHNPPQPYIDMIQGGK